MKGMEGMESGDGGGAGGGGGGGGGVWRAEALIYASTRRFDGGRLWYCLQCLLLILLFLVGVAPSTLARLYGRRAGGPWCWPCRWTSEAPTEPPGSPEGSGPKDGALLVLPR